MCVPTTVLLRFLSSHSTELIAAAAVKGTLLSSLERLLHWPLFFSKVILSRLHRCVLVFHCFGYDLLQIFLKREYSKHVGE